MRHVVPPGRKLSRNSDLILWSAEFYGDRRCENIGIVGIRSALVPSFLYLPLGSDARKLRRSDVRRHVAAGVRYVAIFIKTPRETNGREQGAFRALREVAGKVSPLRNLLYLVRSSERDPIAESFFWGRHRQMADGHNEMGSIEQQGPSCAHCVA